MSVTAIVRKDFRDGIRSKLLWSLMALFLLSIGGFTYLATRGSPEGEGDIVLLGLLGFSAIFAVIFLIPLTGLVVSIKSIVREREMGSIRILLSLPHTRGEVILGKFIGRSGLLTAAILTGFVPAALILFVQTGELPVFEYVALVLVTILFGVVFVAIGVTVSAFTSTETRATVAGVGVFFLFYMWDSIFGYVNGQLDLFTGDLYLFILRFDLFIIFMDVLFAILSLRHDIPNTSFVDANQFFVENPEAVDAVSQPFYLQHWFAVLILAAWIAVPLAIGYLRFENIDL
ncbi:ABC transporter permease subunit [Natronosalvus vescus]|uniref:ABC transporter permease subunit n=1 Tax=Natronosalvus vescus TaxID=2953881 RepID=UPI0020916E46|nr:ABC transporter permease subunit [Natronosalvus vescus]